MACHEQSLLKYHNASMNTEERIVIENRIRNILEVVITVNPAKRRVNNFDEKNFYVYNIIRFPHDKILYLIKSDLLNKLFNASTELLNQFRDRKRQR